MVYTKFVSWALYCAYIRCSNSHLGAIQKARTLWWRGEGVLQKGVKTYMGTRIFQEHTYAYIKQCFHIFTTCFCFPLLWWESTNSNTLKNWHSLYCCSFDSPKIPRYQPLEIQFDHNFFQLKKISQKRFAHYLNRKPFTRFQMFWGSKCDSIA